MIPQRPYLVRAIYQWVVDNGMTPHVVVNAALDGVQVPMKESYDTLDDALQQIGAKE